MGLKCSILVCYEFIDFATNVLDIVVQISEGEIYFVSYSACA